MKEFTLKTKLYLLIACVGGGFLLGWNLFHLQASNPLMLAALSILGSLALVFKVEGATQRSHYSINFLIYGFAQVLLGTPAGVLVILVSNVVGWIWHKTTWYIQAFNIACYIFAVQAAGLVTSWINPSGELNSLSGVLAIALGMGAFTLLNHLMVGIILWLARGEDFKQSGMFEPLPMMIDLTLLTLGGSMVLVWEFNPFAVLLFTIPLYLIYSTLKVPMLERKADTDPKTGLFNHHYFDQHMDNELSRANRFDRPMTIIMADLDLLRNINNTYGHLAGDEVLIGIAKILKQSVREYDVVARFGGEEFAILLPETGIEPAYERAEMIRRAVEKAEFSVPTSITPIKATMSFGIACRENFHQPSREIVHNADSALYHSKLEGRNRTFIYSNGDFESFTEGEHEHSFLLAGDTTEEVQAPAELYKAAHARYETVTPDSEPTRPENGSDVASPARPMPAKSASSRPALSVKAYIGLVFLTAGVLFTFGFSRPPVLDGLGLVIFALMVIVTEWFSIDIYIRDTSISTSAAPILVGTLLYGPLGSLVLSLAFALTAWIKFRSPLNRFIFNLSNQLIAGMLYTIPLSFLKINFLAGHALTQAIVCIVAGFLVYASTTALIAFGMHLDMKVPYGQIWREKFGWLAPYYIAFGVVAYTLSYGYLTAGLMGLAAILIPLFLIRWSQKQYIGRTREMVNELREKNAELEKSSDEISQLNGGLLDTLAELIDLRDPYVLGHSRQVTRYAVMMAKDLRLNKKQIELIYKASLLHDVGKLGIPESILLKPTRLTASEYEVMKSHSTLGAEILKKSSSLIPLIPIVEHHHERYDGNGYPRGLVGKAIPIEARIVAVADAIEAMTSDRPYRKALSIEQIRDELMRCSGTQFDPQVVSIALKIIDREAQNIFVNMGYLSKISDRVLLPGLNVSAD